jgi:hypothetical protein
LKINKSCIKKSPLNQGVAYWSFPLQTPRASIGLNSLIVRNIYQFTIVFFLVIDTVSQKMQFFENMRKLLVRSNEVSST